MLVYTKVDVPESEIFNHLIAQGIDKVFEFIQDLDEAISDENFTRKLKDYFVREVEEYDEAYGVG